MNISPNLQRTLSRSALKISKHSPTILTVVGIAGLLTAGVIAAKQTLKLEATLDNSNARLENVKHHVEEGDATQRDVNKAVIANSVDLVKLYWLPVTLGIASGTVILVGHSILHKRNLALVGAYATLQEAYNNYRQRVVEEYGAEADEKFRYGIRDVVELDDNGKKTKSQTVDPTFDYVFSFGPENDNWNGVHEHNLFFVTRFQQIFNDKLQVRGHVFLNDVLRALGMEDTKAGAVTGWVWKNPTGVSDGYIDFGIKDLQDSHGYILLDFNVDGLILDQI
jgi:hypothetical protein